MSESSERLEQIDRQQADDYWVLVRQEVCAAYLGMQVIPVPYLEDAEHYDLLNVVLKRSKDMGSRLFQSKALYPVGPLSGILASPDSSNIQMMEQRIKHSIKYQGDLKHEEMVIDEGVLKSIKLIVKNINKEVSLFLLKPWFLQVSQDVPWINSVRSIYIVYEVFYSTNFQLLVTHNRLIQQFKTERRIPIGFLCKKFRLESNGMIGEELHIKKSPREATFVNTRSITCVANVSQHHRAAGEACSTSSTRQKVSSFLRCILTECCLSDGADPATARSREDQGCVNGSEAGSSPPRPPAAWISLSSPLPLRTRSLFSRTSTHTSSGRSPDTDSGTRSSAASASPNPAETSTPRPMAAREVVVASQPPAASEGALSPHSPAGNALPPPFPGKGSSSAQSISGSFPPPQPPAQSAVLRRRPGPAGEHPRGASSSSGSRSSSSGSRSSSSGSRSSSSGSRSSPTAERPPLPHVDASALLPAICALISLVGAVLMPPVATSPAAVSRPSCRPHPAQRGPSRVLPARKRPFPRPSPTSGSSQLENGRPQLPRRPAIPRRGLLAGWPDSGPLSPVLPPSATARRGRVLELPPLALCPSPWSLRTTPGRTLPGPGICPWCGCAQTAQPRGVGVSPATPPRGVGVTDLTPPRGVTAATQSRGVEVSPATPPRGVGVSPATPPRGVGVTPATTSRGVEVSPATPPRGVGVSPATPPRGVGVTDLTPPRGVTAATQSRGVEVSPATPPRGVGVSPATPPRGVGVSPATPPRGVGVTPATTSRGMSDLTPPRGVGVTAATQSRGVEVSPATPPRGVGVSPATPPRGVGVTDLTPPRGVTAATQSRGVEVSPATPPRGVGVSPATTSRGVGVSPATPPRGVGVSPATPPRGVGVSPATTSRGVGVTDLTPPRGVGVTAATQSRGVEVSPATPPRGVGVSPATPPRGVGVSPATTSRGVWVTDLTPPRGVGVTAATQSRGVEVSPATPPRGVGVSPATPPRGVGVTDLTPPRGVGVTAATQSRGVGVSPATPPRGVGVSPATPPRGVGADAMPDSCRCEWEQRWAAMCPDPESPCNVLKQMMPSSSDSEAEDRPTGLRC
ncbi:mucin-5AC-like isoform X2 [Narcine bancroftii]|uniref:mucin-5AC-like isoform X2 n=1 Tax=Narcine bancroftii TaxID=1343680 RepID=UPI00383132FB